MTTKPLSDRIVENRLKYHQKGNFIQGWAFTFYALLVAILLKVVGK
jgi:hypothetical protein